MTDSPSEEWKSLDWATATKKTSVYESWEGCPIQTVDGAHFLGHGRTRVTAADKSAERDRLHCYQRLFNPVFRLLGVEQRCVQRGRNL